MLVYVSLPQGTWSISLCIFLAWIYLMNHQSVYSCRDWTTSIHHAGLSLNFAMHVATIGGKSSIVGKKHRRHIVGDEYSSPKFSASYIHENPTISHIENPSDLWFWPSCKRRVSPRILSEQGFTICFTRPFWSVTFVIGPYRHFHDVLSSPDVMWV